MVMNAKLSNDLYIRFRDLLRTRCGLAYPERKRDDLAHSLHMVLTVTQQPNFAALYADASAGGPSWDAIITQLTIGETYFFRNDAQFDALREYIVPDLLSRRAVTRTLRLWSAGCATGEEPYSIAILLSELLPDNPAWNISMLATDINPVFLARAREARYSNWSFRETPAALRDRYWTAEQGHWRLHPAIRRMVTFAALNLAEPCYPMITNGTSALDMIICRNVTIYFDADTTQQVAERFYHALVPGGWLIVGHAEPQTSVYRKFEVHNFPNTVMYRKPLDAPLFAVDSTSRSFNTKPPAIGSGESSWAQLQVTPPEDARQRDASMATGAKKHRDPHISQQAQPAVIPALPTTPPRTETWPVLAARLAQGDTAGAEPLLQAVLCDHPAHLPARLALGKWYADCADWRNAEAQCMLALAQDALCIPAQYLLAQIHEHQGHLDAALAAYRRTVYLDSQFVPGMLGLAHIWHQLGRSTEAQRALRNVVQHLAALPPTAPLPGIAGATVGEVLGLAQQQLAALLRSK